VQLEVDQDEELTELTGCNPLFLCWWLDSFRNSDFAKSIEHFHSRSGVTAIRPHLKAWIERISSTGDYQSLVISFIQEKSNFMSNFMGEISQIS